MATVKSMTNDKEDTYADGIKKMVLGDPYASVHVWICAKSNEYLKKLKETSGIKPKKGFWSPSEIMQLKENMELYKSLNPNVDVFTLIYEGNSKEKTSIFKETRFLDILAFNLCRTLDSIRTTIKHHFMKQAGFKTGGFTKDEYSYMKELVMKHGKEWPLISRLMKRSSVGLSAVYHHCVKNNINQGKWKNDEKKRFFQIVKKLLQYNKRHGLSLYKIRWGVVSNFVKTRSEYSCKYFGTSKKGLLETLLVQKDFTLLQEKSMALYMYFSKVPSLNAIDIKELILLFDNKFGENELRKEFKKN